MTSIRTYKALDLNSPAVKKAMQRCKADKPCVHVVSLDAGLFSVRSRSRSNETYVIRLIITPNGKCLHECTCAAGKSGQVCVHVVGCFIAWGGIVAARQEAERLSAAADGTQETANEPEQNVTVPAPPPAPRTAQEKAECEQSVLIRRSHQREVKFGAISI